MSKEVIMESLGSDPSSAALLVLALWKENNSQQSVIQAHSDAHRI